MRILFLGDIVGQPGLRIVRKAIPILRRTLRLDLVIANAENASGGSGLYPSTCRQLRQSGVDALTMGDHIYKKAEIFSLLEHEPICKAANFPPEAPGKEFVICQTTGGTQLAIISLLGRTYMRPVDCPFHAVDRVLNLLPPEIKCIFVDIHAEATGDKYQMLHHLKGRVSAVVGTHTHVQTADEHITPQGTAFLCDVGMTGPYDSILGRKIDRILTTTVSFVPTIFEVAEGDPRLAGVLIEMDDPTDKATHIQRLMIRDEELLSVDPATNPT